MWIRRHANTYQNELLRAIQRLPTKIEFLPRSYKAMWMQWLTGYEDKRYGRANPNRSAEFIYNALNYPEMIIWLAAASRVNPQLIREATDATGRKDSRMAQSATLRRLLPWSLIATHLSDATSRSSGSGLLLDVDEIYRGLPEQTTRQTLIEARLGQSDFRFRVSRRWNDRCALTGCSITAILRASHIKPWSEASNRERLDPANGILLIAHVDALFDSGLISFANDGAMLVSALIADDLKQLHLPDRLRRQPAKAEQRFLAHHRRHVFAA
ncbi:MAG: HNH endonuclease [Beijerinckiaceae bacterium]